MSMHIKLIPEKAYMVYTFSEKFHFATFTYAYMYKINSIMDNKIESRISCLKKNAILFY